MWSFLKTFYKKNWSRSVYFGLQFSKDSGKLTEELKLRVVYISPNSSQGSSRDDTMKNSAQKLDTYSVSFSCSPSPLGNLFQVLLLCFLSNLLILCIKLESSSSHMGLDFKMQTNFTHLWWFKPKKWDKTSHSTLL